MHEEIPLPMNLDVEENLFFGLGWTQMAYVIAGLFVGIVLGGLLPLPDQQRLFILAASVGVGVILALTRPYQRGLLAWAMVIAAFYRRPRVVSWRPDEPDPDLWGIGLPRGDSAVVRVGPRRGRFSRE